MAVNVALAKPPEVIPEAYSQDVASLHSSVATLFARKQIPYSVQAAIAKDGYITLEDIADRWDDAAAARTNGPRVLGFDPGNNGFTEQSSAFAAMRLFQAIKAAKDMTKNIYAPRSRITPGQGTAERSGLEVLCDRQQLLTEWAKETGLPKPKLEAQGSDALLKSSASAPKVSWASSTPSISSVLSLNWRRNRSRPDVRSRLMAGTKRRKRKNASSPPPDDIWIGCIESFGIGHVSLGFPPIHIVRCLQA